MKRIILFATLLLASVVAFAQSPTLKIINNSSCNMQFFMKAHTPGVPPCFNTGGPIPVPNHSVWGPISYTGLLWTPPLAGGPVTFDAIEWQVISGGGPPCSGYIGVNCGYIPQGNISCCSSAAIYWTSDASGNVTVTID